MSIDNSVLKDVPKDLEEIQKDKEEKTGINEEFFFLKKGNFMGVIFFGLVFFQRIYFLNIKRKQPPFYGGFFICTILSFIGLN